MRGFLNHLRTSDAGRVMPALVAELSRSPELAQAFREGFVQPRRAKVLEAVRRGVERGEVGAGVDPELVPTGSSPFPEPGRRRDRPRNPVHSTLVQHGSALDNRGCEGIE